jgi:hypothetical protein
MQRIKIIDDVCMLYGPSYPDRISIIYQVTRIQSGFGDAPLVSTVRKCSIESKICPFDLDFTEIY